MRGTTRTPQLICHTRRPWYQSRHTNTDSAPDKLETAQNYSTKNGLKQPRLEQADIHPKYDVRKAIAASANS